MHSFSSVSVEIVVQILEYLIALLVLHDLLEQVAFMCVHFLAPTALGFLALLDECLSQHLVDFQDVHVDDCFDDVTRKLVRGEFHQVVRNLEGDDLEVSLVDALDDGLDDVVAEFVGGEFLEVLQDGLEQPVDLGQLDLLQRLGDHLGAREGLRDLQDVFHQLVHELRTPDVVVTRILLHVGELLAVQHVLHQQGGVGVVDHLGLDRVVVEDFEAQREDFAHLHVFDHLGEHDEAELVECKFSLLGLEGCDQLHLLESVGLLHEFDHDEVGHVVVGETLEVLAHDVDDHVEVHLVLELVHLVLDG